jgi:hypothetical protein
VRGMGTVTSHHEIRGGRADHGHGSQNDVMLHTTMMGCAGCYTFSCQFHRSFDPCLTEGWALGPPVSEGIGWNGECEHQAPCKLVPCYRRR